MKRTLSFILSIIMTLGILTSVPVIVNAADAASLSFKYDSATGGYAVTDCDTAISGELVIPDTYNNAPVTIIGVSAFRDCTSLSSVTIPDTVVCIDLYAFYNCTSLYTVNFSNNLTQIKNYAFYNCSYLQELNLPSSLEFIGNYAFAGVSVGNLNIPDNVYYIADNAFYDAELVNVVLGKGVEIIGEYAFSRNSSLKSIVIPESVKYIGAGAFENSKYIEKIYITDIAKWCNIEFGNAYANPLVYCYNLYTYNNKFCYLYLNGEPLLDLVIPESIDTIKRNAFMNYTHLKSVTLHNGVKKIETDAFYGTDSMGDVFVSSAEAWFNIDFESLTANPLSCGDIPRLYFNGELVTSVKVPESVTIINNYAFSNYGSLESVELHENIAEIGTNAFYGTALYNNTENWENGGLYIDNCLVAANSDFSGDYVIKDGTRVIAKEAFKNIGVIESVKIPDSVTKIDNRTFFNCYSLVSVDLGNGVTILEDQAFYDCINLTSINLNENIKKIGKYAFYGCSSLSMDLSLGDNMEYIGDYAFYNCTGITSARIKGDNCEMGSYVFSQCTGMKNVVLDGIKVVGERAFYGCSELENVQLINVEVVDECAFINCISLKTIDFGSALKEISDNAFASNTALENINLPETLEYIGYWAFGDCEALTEVVIGKNIKEIDDYAFYDCEGLTEIKVYSEAAEISSMAFLGCDNVTSLYLGTQSAVNEIYPGIFYNLKELVLGEGVTEIPADRYNGNYFSEITIPKSVTQIGNNAFMNCEKLTTVYYGGSPSKWEAISIGSNNEPLLNAEIIFAEHDHQPSEEWIVDEDSTCSEEGSQHKECVICGIVVETQAIPLKPHTPGGDWILDYDAKCTKEGKGHRNCEICGEIAEIEYIPATGHTTGDWIIDSPATVYKAGKKHKECEDCGETVKTATIKQLKCSAPKLKSIDNTENGVKITWGKVKGADTYRVYRKTSKTDWECIDSTSKTYYTDKTAKSGTKYYYAVKTRNEAGNSSLSDDLSKYYLADPTLKTPSSTKNGVVLKWNKISGAEGYMVYRKTGSGSYERIATVKGNSKVTYTDKKAKKGKKYTYKVKAYKSKTYSAYSDTKTITDKY